MSTNYISISNNTVQLFAFHIQDGNQQVKIKLVPGLNLGIKESYAAQFRNSRAFKHYEEQGWLTYINSDSLDKVESAKEKFGKKLLDDENGQPIRAIYQEGLTNAQKNQPYLPTKDLLVSLNGIGAKTADKIIARGEKIGGWKSFTDMADKLKADYPSVKFVKEDKGVS